MRSLARDIQLTLFIKFFLLFILWFVCFKNTEKPAITTQQWMLGSEPSLTQPKPISLSNNNIGPL